ncbi:MAG: 50S ribosomal protein L29 [Candidatus Aenigmatarchaeota archaeon]
MAIIRKKAMREMGREDAKKKVAELRLELAKDRAQVAVGASPVNPGKIKETRRGIARLLTLVKSKEEAMLKQALTIKGNTKTKKGVVGAG